MNSAVSFKDICDVGVVNECGSTQYTDYLVIIECYQSMSPGVPSTTLQDVTLFCLYKPAYHTIDIDDKFVTNFPNNS